MTEADWQSATNPLTMLEFLARRPLQRQLTLAHLRDPAGAAVSALGNPPDACDLIRDLYGNPFRAVTLAPAVRAWNGGAILLLAEAIHNDAAFDRLPILADALEEAGCTNEDILTHCRSGPVHVRGCWVLDLLLRKRPT